MKPKDSLHSNTGFQLRPCPFCGKQLEIMAQNHPIYSSITSFGGCSLYTRTEKRYTIIGHDKDCYITTQMAYKSKDKLIKRWNSRIIIKDDTFRNDLSTYGDFLEER